MLFRSERSFTVENNKEPFHSVKLTLLCRLGDGEDDIKCDLHHPYVFYNSGEADAESKSKMPALIKNDGKLELGWVKHFSDIKKGDELLLYPNYFDFEFLDCTARRFDLVYQGKKRDKYIIERPTRPFLMEELKQVLDTLWQNLKLTDTQLNNIQTLLVNKLNDWQRDTGGIEQFDILVESIIGEAFNEPPEIVKDAMKNGHFFDCLELYQSILKEKIKEKQAEEGW